MTDSELKFVGFGAFFFAFGSALTLTLAVANGYLEWTPAMLAASGTATAIFVILFVWEVVFPFWRGLKGRTRTAAPPLEFRSMTLEERRALKDFVDSQYRAQFRRGERPLPPNAVRPPPPPVPPLPPQRGD